MRSYSESNVFSARDINTWKLATRLVGCATDLKSGREIRCHELARAVGLILDLEPQEGHFGIMEHTWLWTSGPGPQCKILDVYTPGSLPQVQLVDYGALLPYFRNYKPLEAGRPKYDINEEDVADLKEQMTRQDWGAGPPNTLY